MLKRLLRLEAAVSFYALHSPPPLPVQHWSFVYPQHLNIKSRANIYFAFFPQRVESSHMSINLGTHVCWCICVRVCVWSLKKIHPRQLLVNGKITCICCQFVIKSSLTQITLEYVWLLKYVVNGANYTPYPHSRKQGILRTLKCVRVYIHMYANSLFYFLRIPRRWIVELAVGVWAET